MLSANVYIDNISGKLSDNRFMKLSEKYKKEQEDLKVMFNQLQKELKEQEQKKMNVRKFVNMARKYTKLKKLDATIVREFIDKILVSAKDKKIKTQEITIVYNFFGAFDFNKVIHQAKNEDKNRKVGVI